MPRSFLLILLFVFDLASAGPYIAPGDSALRHDIQRLADYGVIDGPVTTWPLAWGPVLRDLERASVAELPPDVLDALVRVKQRARWETRAGTVTFNARVGAADNATRIRSFDDTPRGRAEVSAGLDWTGSYLSADINVQYVDSLQDDGDIRADDSFVGILAGNWSLAASTQQRWWGPGRDGSLILSNNARPIPAIVLDRVFTSPFETRWLSWLGPWDLNVIFGQLEEDRHIPNAMFFGMRFNFRPIRSLEIGLSRGAQWCGDGRPCGFDTFLDMLIGRDNVEGQDEPGNQLAGVDARWTPGFLNGAVAVYGQLIGEDEAGGFPSRYIGQAGIEWSTFVFNRWSAGLFAEFADTTAEFYAAEPRYNYAYNHGIYQTGYRFRSRTIGHGADNDSKLLSAGLLLVDASEVQWRLLLRAGELNSGGPPDSRNSLTPTRQDVWSVDLAHSRAFTFGVVEAGVGYEQVDDVASGSDEGEGRFYIQWRSSY